MLQIWMVVPNGRLRGKIIPDKPVFVDELTIDSSTNTLILLPMA